MNYEVNKRFPSYLPRTDGKDAAGRGRIFFSTSPQINIYHHEEDTESHKGNRKKLLAQCYKLREGFLTPYLADAATRDIPLIVCGDVNDGPGFDTSEMKLQASGVERLMGSVWESELCFGNALYEALPARDRERLNFSRIYTASFEDPIFDGNYHRVWIDHVLYSKNRGGARWAHSARVCEEMPDEAKIYRAFPNASDHFPITCEIET